MSKINTQLSRIQELDTVLKRISLAEHGYTYFDELISDLSRIDHVKIDPDFLTSIITKLLIDKYISDDKTLLEGKWYNGEKVSEIKTQTFTVTWDGLYLLENGGYKGEYLRVLTRTENDKKILKGTYNLNKWVACGAIGLLFWEIWKWVFPIPNDFLVFLCCNSYAETIVLSIAIIVIFSLTVCSNCKK